MSKFAKFVSVVLAAATIVSFVPVTNAQTTSDLQAQISALLAQIAALQAQLGTGGGSSSAGHQYTKDLTLGARGADVTALQNFLFSNGFLKVAATGYFGPMTKAALAAYQASVGISPASGYFGPITRARLNSVAVSPSPVVTTPGVSPSPSVSTGPLTGGEGIITVEENGTPAESVKVYEGDVDAGVLGLKVKAQNSDLRVERVKVQIGTAVTSYTKQMSALSIWDGSTLLQKVNLNANTVTKEDGNYFVYFTGLNTVVPNNTTKIYTIKTDIPSTVENTYQGSVTLTVPANAVRVKDATGLDLYGPTTAFTHVFSIQNSLSESASLSIAKSTNSPDSTAIVSNNTGDVSEAPVLAFDLKATDGLVEIDELNVQFYGNSTETTAYLYDGSTLLQSATVSSNSATFTDMQDIFKVPADTTKTFTIKVDYSGATDGESTSALAIYSDTGHKFVALNADGSAINETGSATSSTMVITKGAPVFSLTSATAAYQTAQYSGATNSLSGTFNFTVKAEGNDIYFSSSTLPAFAIDVVDGAGNATAIASTSITYVQPSGIESTSGYYKIPEGTSATFSVSAATTSVALGKYYHFVLDDVYWSTSTNQSLYSDYLDQDFITDSKFAE